METKVEEALGELVGALEQIQDSSRLMFEIQKDILAKVNALEQRIALLEKPQGVG